MTYDVTLYWHDGGSVFLGSVSARSSDEAETDALNAYMAESVANAKEIERGGDFALEAVPYR